MKTKFIVFLLMVAMLVNACAPSAVPTEESPAPILTEEPLPAQIEPAHQPELPVSTAWKTVRDAHYGFGLAVPCWWLVNPIPEQGMGGVMTIMNYDEAYFMAHSNKGFWEWPNGTLKLDVVIMEGVDPEKSDVDAYIQFVDPSMNGLVAAEPQQVGSHTATVVTISNLVNPNDPNTKLFIFRLASDKLLMVVPFPQSSIDTPDFQAVLASIVLAPNEQVVLPVIAPAPALIDAPCAP